MDCCFFSACGFFYLRLCAVHLLCAFRVWTDAFAFLYVSEFLTAACGVSPLRGRPKDSALWNPAALERLANFFFWVRVCWCCSPEHKKQNEPHKSSALHKQNAKSPLRGRITISLNISKATASRAVSRKNSADAALYMIFTLLLLWILPFTFIIIIA